MIKELFAQIVTVGNKIVTKLSEKAVHVMERTTESVLMTVRNALNRIDKGIK